MRVQIFWVIAAATIGVTAVAQKTSDADVKRYQECVVAATKDDITLAAVVAACVAPAEAGIPGAQYLLGITLVSRDEAGDRSAGIDWLEKSAATGNPAAAFALAGFLLQQDAPASQTRGRDLLKSSVCTGYPHALQAFEQAGVTRDKIACPPVPEEDFRGEWIAELKVVNSGLAGDVDKHKFKIVLSDDEARVFTNGDSDWREVKPGRFKMERNKQSVTITAADSGWDFDGEWIESWTIQLLRTGVDDAHAVFLRTVNNPHMPRGFSWRAFSSFAEGTAVRAKN